MLIVSDNVFDTFPPKLKNQKTINLSSNIAFTTFFNFSKDIYYNLLSHNEFVIDMNFNAIHANFLIDYVIPHMTKRTETRYRNLHAKNRMFILFGSEEKTCKIYKDPHKELSPELAVFLLAYPAMSRLSNTGILKFLRLIPSPDKAQEIYPLASVIFKDKIDFEQRYTMFFNVSGFLSRLLEPFFMPKTICHQLFLPHEHFAEHHSEYTLQVVPKDAEICGPIATIQEQGKSTIITLPELIITKKKPEKLVAFCTALCQYLKQRGVIEKIKKEMIKKVYVPLCFPKGKKIISSSPRRKYTKYILKTPDTTIIFEIFELIRISRRSKLKKAKSWTMEHIDIIRHFIKHEKYTFTRKELAKIFRLSKNEVFEIMWELRNAIERTAWKKEIKNPEIIIQKIMQIYGLVDKKVTNPKQNKSPSAKQIESDIKSDIVTILKQIYKIGDKIETSLTRVLTGTPNSGYILDLTKPKI